MKDLVNNGYAEKVPDAEYDQQLNCYYTSHHGVYSSQKPDELRVVFDCSAKFNGFSLNDNLLTGTDLSCTLLGVLIRFRQKKIPLKADIACHAMNYQTFFP